LIKRAALGNPPNTGHDQEAASSGTVNERQESGVAFSGVPDAGKHGIRYG
jgi:hypothetical protein